MPRTHAAFMWALSRVGTPKDGVRLLDVGCGDGYFTASIGEKFHEVHGVDVQPENILAFNERIGDRFVAHLASADSLDFPDAYFDAIVSLETLEHVANLPGTAKEVARVCRPGGQLVITVPNRWFPCENHGGRIFGRHIGRLPLLTYLPWLHDRIADARVFTVGSLDRLIIPVGFKPAGLAYLWPTFEHGGNPFQKLLRYFAPLMRIGEVSPVRFFGTSIVRRYIRLS